MDKKEKNEEIEKNENNVKIEKNDKKNFSIIIAIALISILVVAMICIGFGKKDNDNDNDNEVPSGNNNFGYEDIISGDNEIPDWMDPDNIRFPEFEENTERDAEGNKVNVSPNIKEKMTFDFIDLTNISLKYGDGTTSFDARIMNNSDKDYLLGVELKITFYDNDGREIYETHMLTSALYAHKESSLQARFTMDCSYADTFDIEIIEHEMQ